ncbi:uncharacterized protein AB675_7556 [Cyphellophora attinorum]|uniref:Uncharacterized protein n=1 Tax=Cyphellophora attinorum TaxID=1664694 RepID=A0A0N0NME1_9EURO|nr:uncharacterized protein AB675_7556 [Phialophora attinorum]KPI40248.1 hypothetical protein AB675_7556 [Phialophora attinorum]
MPEQINNPSGNTQGHNFPKNYGPSKPNGPLGPVIKEHYDNGLWHRK